MLKIGEIVLLDPALDAEYFGELFFIRKGGLVRLTHLLVVEIKRINYDLGSNNKHHSQAIFLSNELIAKDIACKIENG